MLHSQPVKRSKKSIEKVLQDSTVSKSAKIKFLWETGYSVKQVAEELGIRYNFAYNVVSNWVTVETIEVVKPVKDSTKKQLIVEQWKQGSTLKEISVNLRTNYNYVFNVVKDYKATQVTEE
jgi:DNA-binding CsgD family transcriptional regulator